MSRLWLIGVGAFVAILIVTGLVVALVTTRNGDLLPAGSPEGTVQRYLTALKDKEYAEAYTYLAATPGNHCTKEQFIQEASRYGELRDSHMTLEDTRQFNDTAIVTARVTIFEPDISFPPSEYSYDRTFDLKLEDGAWRLVWPDYYCPPPY